MRRIAKFAQQDAPCAKEKKFQSQLQRYRQGPTAMNFWRRVKLKSGCSSNLKSNRFKLAEPTGFEPATSDVTGRRSNQLNYDSAFQTREIRGRWSASRSTLTPDLSQLLLVGTEGLEPPTSSL